MNEPEHSFSHIDDQHNPRMVDVSGKQASPRTARASGLVHLPPEVQQAIRGDDILSAKGPVFQTAILAGVMAAKRTSDLIPFCHPVGLDDCLVQIDRIAPDTLRVQATTRVCQKTGVEMEALTAVTVAALTIYDMCKSLSHDLRISDIQLLEKTGGKRDFIRDP